MRGIVLLFKGRDQDDHSSDARIDGDLTHFIFARGGFNLFSQLGRELHAENRFNLGHYDNPISESSSIEPPLQKDKTRQVSKPVQQGPPFAV